MHTAPQRFIALAALATLTAFASAEIVSVDGATEIEATEIVSEGSPTSLSDSDSYPSGSDQLPLQTVGQLVASTLDGAASLGAQLAEPNLPDAAFADPNSLDPNAPSDFAISVGLGSTASGVSYDGVARVTATRTILFSEGELGDQPAGTTVDLIGNVQLEGALTILSESTGQDLSSATVALNVWVYKRAVGGDESIQVMSGAITLTGNANGGADATASGQIPVTDLSRNDLSILVPDFSVFEVLIIPAIQVEYEYQADVGEQFILETVVEIEAYCPGGGTVVAGILGTEYEVLVDVISLLQDAGVAEAAQTAVAGEIYEPTGEPAFPSSRASETDDAADDVAAVSFCAPLGFSSMLGLAALCLISGARRPRLVRRSEG